MRTDGSALVLVRLLVSLLSAVGLKEQASAAEPDEMGAVEGSKTPSQPVSTGDRCGQVSARSRQTQGVPRPAFTTVEGE